MLLRRLKKRNQDQGRQDSAQERPSGRILGRQEVSSGWASIQKPRPAAANLPIAIDLTSSLLQEVCPDLPWLVFQQAPAVSYLPLLLDPDPLRVSGSLQHFPADMTPNWILTQESPEVAPLSVSSSKMGPSSASTTNLSTVARHPGWSGENEWIDE